MNKTTQISFLKTRMRLTNYAITKRDLRKNILTYIIDEWSNIVTRYSGWLQSSLLIPLIQMLFIFKLFSFLSSSRGRRSYYYTRKSTGHDGGSWSLRNIHHRWLFYRQFWHKFERRSRRAYRDHFRLWSRRWRQLLWECIFRLLDSQNRIGLGWTRPGGNLIWITLSSTNRKFIYHDY